MRAAAAGGRDERRITVIPDAPDLARMRADRRGKLHDALARKDASTAVLVGTTNVRWATGARVVAAAQAGSPGARNVVFLTAGDPVPHLCTHTPEGVPADHPADHVPPGLDLES